MESYNPPVAGLLKLGETQFGGAWADYTAFGIGADHIPELIRLVQDKELAQLEDGAPEVYAQVHTWRALGQLRAEAAIQPLPALLAEQEFNDPDDWTTEEIPRVLAMIGPAALVPTAARLLVEHRFNHTPGEYSQALTEIAKGHPETRDEVVEHLRAFLRLAPENDPSMNGFVIANLLDLEAEEAWPTIEVAFTSGNVDESIAGDADQVKHELGLGPKPPDRAPMRFLPPMRPGNAKQRFEARQRQKKLEKKANKKKQKGK
jgi:hypothetical protein